MTQANSDSRGGWTLRQIQDEIKTTKRKMTKTGTQEAISAAEFAEVIGEPYNNAWVKMNRASIPQLQEGYPAQFDRLAALELAESVLHRRRKREMAPEDLAKEVAKGIRDTGVPQPLRVVCERAGISIGRNAEREFQVAREAVKRGLIFITEAHGREFYLPTGATAKGPKKGPDLGQLNETEQAVYAAIVKTYSERLVPASMVEIGRMIKNKFPRYPVLQLVDKGLVRKAATGEKLLFVPVGWSIVIKK